MKLSELRPCDACGGKVAPFFYVIDSSQAFVTPAAGRTLGLASMMSMSGRATPASLKLAETMGPEADDAVIVTGEKDRKLRDRLLICQACMLSGPIDLTALNERAHSAALRAEDESAAS